MAHQPMGKPLIQLPQTAAAPLVTINKVANEVVNTNTTSTEISAYNGLLQKNAHGNCTPAEAAPIRNTTVVTNQTSTSHSNPPEKAAAEAPKDGKTDNGSAAERSTFASPSAHKTAASEGPAPKSVDVSFSKPTPASNSDGPQTSESSSPHKVATEVSVSSTPAGPDEAAAKKVQ
ncbi:hypothetical protein VP01_4253g2, partial [Puccinia sorghi]